MFRRKKSDNKSISDGVEPYLARKPEARPTCEPAAANDTASPFDLLTVGRNLDFETAEPFLAARPAGAQIEDFTPQDNNPAPLPADCLMIGEELNFDGAIESCDHLIVRGAAVSDIGTCHKLDISPDGNIRGTATVDEADIAGSFEGELTVHGCLRIRATGCVRGLVTYGSLAVEPGGQLLGTVRVVGDGARAQPSAVVVPLRLRRHDRP